MKTERSKLEEKLASMKKEGFDYLVGITAVDYVDHVEAIYFVRDIDKASDESLEIELDPADLWLPSVMNQHPSADWYERELAEMFGIEIRGRKVKRLLLEKWDGKGSPLRKSFKWSESY